MSPDVGAVDPSAQSGGMFISRLISFVSTSLFLRRYTVGISSSHSYCYKSEGGFLTDLIIGCNGTTGESSSSCTNSCKPTSGASSIYVLFKNGIEDLILVAILLNAPVTLLNISMA